MNTSFIHLYDVLKRIPDVTEEKAKMATEVVEQTDRRITRLEVKVNIGLALSIAIFITVLLK